MRRLFAAFVFAFLATPCVAQPWYARGEFNGWDQSAQMVDQGGGHYTSTISGLFGSDPGTSTYFYSEYKVACCGADGWDINAPGSNGKVAHDAAGEIHLHLWDNTTWNDGWFPNNTRRVGYDDPGVFGWEVVGSFNGWPAAGDPTYYLNGLGNGLYSKDIGFATPGIYQFKFRQQGSWNVAIGNDFGNAAGNNRFRAWDPNDSFTFSLDLPNGRWQAVPDQPTPDLNGDDYVDASDYVLWRKSNGSAQQYARWRAHFGDTPPPPDESQFYARGTWNSFGLSNPLTNEGGCCNLHDGTVTGLTPGSFYNFTLANNDFTISAPNPFNDGRVAADATGEIKFNFYNQTTWTDGWMPDNQRRAGYADPGQYGWELMGEFNGWAGGAQYVMTDQGGGLYRVETPLAAGTYQFKFRRWDAVNGGNWDTSIGANFGNSAANASTGALIGGTYAFELDLARGAWRVSPVSAGSGSLTSGAVPEPASLALVLFGVALAGSVRRRE